MCCIMDSMQSRSLSLLLTLRSDCVERLFLANIRFFNGLEHKVQTGDVKSNVMFMKISYCAKLLLCEAYFKGINWLKISDVDS